MEFKHYSVLRDETIENLNIRPDGIYVDGTLGGAGHSYEIAKRLSDKGRLIGIDQDADAIKAAVNDLLSEPVINGVSRLLQSPYVPEKSTPSASTTSTAMPGIL